MSGRRWTDGTVDPQLAGLSEAEQIRLSGVRVHIDEHGIRLEDRQAVPARLAAEVKGRWAGRNETYERGWRDRDVLAAQATREFVAEACRWRRNCRTLFWVAAAGWLTVFIVLAWISR